jgi:multidrug resistance efflux pump
MSWIRTKLFWIFGLLLLIGSLLGANYWWNAPRNGDPNGGGAPPAANANRNATTGVVAPGTMEPENNAIALSSSAFGEVIKVFVKAEQQVKKGDRLLQIDDRQAKAILDQADAGVKNAESLVKDARTAFELYAERIKGQKEKIAGKRAEVQSHAVKLARAQDLVNKKVVTDTSDVEAAKYLIEGLERGIKAEESVLKGFELDKPDNKLTQAEANLDAAKAKRDQAKLAFDACLMTAPEDGTILKVSVGVGAKIVPQIQQPPFWFYTGGLTIKAHVDQESANKVTLDQKVTVEEMVNVKPKTWTGKVTYIASSFQPKRDVTAIPDLFQQSQESVLECHITLDDGQPMPKLYQKVRVRIAGN